MKGLLGLAALALLSCSQKPVYSFTTSSEFATGRVVSVSLTRYGPAPESDHIDVTVYANKKGKIISQQERMFYIEEGEKNSEEKMVEDLIPFGLLKYNYQEGFLPPESIDEIVIRASTNEEDVEVGSLRFPLTPSMVKSYREEHRRSESIYYLRRR
jgi:hypothetical protein